MATLLLCSATLCEPSEMAFSALDVAPTPIANVSPAVAWAEEPNATLFSPVALDAAPTLVELATASLPAPFAIAESPFTLLNEPMATELFPTTFAFAPIADDELP
ncbi:hypothetical protein SE956_01460 [Escherichia coli]|nr:hypothetical protein [Escherichia coli]MDW9206248.1 hypothetical protein [Escherichia coli]